VRCGVIVILIDKKSRKFSPLWLTRIKAIKPSLKIKKKHTYPILKILQNRIQDINNEFTSPRWGGKLMAKY
jgi:hypothetical protein